MNCQVCNTPDDLKPMCFKGEQYCCEDHRKILDGEVKVEEQ